MVEEATRPWFGLATRGTSIPTSCMTISGAICSRSKASRGCGKVWAAIGGCYVVLATTEAIEMHWQPQETAAKQDVERWKQNGLDSDDLPARRESVLPDPPKKGRKKPRIPSAEKTQVGVVPSSSARVKHLVGADNKKIGGIRNIRDAPLKLLQISLDTVICSVKWFTHELFHLLRGKEMLIFLSEDEGRTERSTHLPNHHDLAVESRAVKHRVDLVLLTPLDVMLATAKKGRKSSTQVKSSSVMLAANPKVDKSSPVWDACVSNLLKDNFLSSPSTCAELINHIHHASDLVTFLSISLEK
ncbi:unnamed protein product [Prunus armeniaca]